MKLLVATKVLEDVLEERERQDKKWGEQNHPDGTGATAFMALTDSASSAEDAKALCKRMAADGHVTYAHILYEEVAEALEEEDEDRLEVELIQVAAVCVQWVETIRRRRAKRKAVAR